ncbi:hypothetical protein KEM54_003197 [Ascosphaera aggregata]|nr:hypothetical protein KEM54_003197 [Ascosphaera aggregata]
MFLTFDEEEDDNNDNDDDVDAAAIRPPPRIVGELELLIAERKNQKCGYGRSALLCFLFYILRHEDVIVRGFLQSKQCNPPPPPSSSHGLQQKLAFFCVKIGANNTGSIRLFESLGFTKIREQPNVFGELELRRTFGDTGRRGIDEITELMEKYDVKQTTEVPYQR